MLITCWVPLAGWAEPRTFLLWIFNSLEGLLLLLLSLLFRQRTCPKRSSSNACSDQEVSADGFSNFCFSLSYWLLHCLSDDVYWGMFWVVEQDPELHCRYQWAAAGGAKPGEWEQQPLCEPGAGGWVRGSGRSGSGHPGALGHFSRSFLPPGPRHCLAHAQLESSSTAESLCCGDCPLLLPPPWYGNSPGKELTQAQLQHAANTSCHGTWHRRDTGLAEQTCWVQAAANNLHRSVNWRRVSPALGPALSRKDGFYNAQIVFGQLQLSELTVSVGLYEWRCFGWDLSHSGLPGKSIPAKLQSMSLIAVLSHNPWTVPVPLLVSEGPKGMALCCAVTHHQFPSEPSALTRLSP